MPKFFLGATLGLFAGLVFSVIGPYALGMIFGNRNPQFLGDPADLLIWIALGVCVLAFVAAVVARRFRRRFLSGLFTGFGLFPAGVCLLILLSGFRG